MRVLVVVDMQVDFVNGSLGTQEAIGIVPKVKARIAQAKADGEMVIFTRDTHYGDYLKTQEGRNLSVEHCIKNTEGWQIVPELREYVEEEEVIDKPTFGSIYLGELLCKMNTEEKIEKVTFIGLCTDICVVSNVLITKASIPEVPVAVEAECCAGVTPQSHENALATMKMCQVQVIGG
ncbi:MAG: cysteine hydrolase [Blautia sp.]|nr:cysteine hydrolase [Blautia sp.]